MIRIKWCKDIYDLLFRSKYMGYDATQKARVIKFTTAA